VVLLFIVPAYLIAFRPYGVRAAALGLAVARPVLGGVVMVAVVFAVRWYVPDQLWQLVIGGALSVAAYTVVVLPLRHEALGVLRRSAA
jgi:PST family polysaccharide transporter